MGGLARDLGWLLSARRSRPGERARRGEGRGRLARRFARAIVNRYGRGRRDAAELPGHAEIFEVELGEVVAFIPMADMPTLSGRPQLIEIPGAELAVTVHNGAISELGHS